MLPEAAYPVAAYVVTAVLEHIGVQKGPYWVPPDTLDARKKYQALMLLLFCDMSMEDEDRLMAVAKWDKLHTVKEVALGIIHEFRRLWPKLSWDAQCIANMTQADMAHYLHTHQEAFVVGRGMHDTKLWQQGDWRCVPAAVLIKNLSFSPPCGAIHYLPCSTAWHPNIISDVVVIHGIIE